MKIYVLVELFQQFIDKRLIYKGNLGLLTENNVTSCSDGVYLSALPHIENFIISMKYNNKYFNFYHLIIF
jgi:hypothetical protein